MPKTNYPSKKIPAKMFAYKEYSNIITVGYKSEGSKPLKEAALIEIASTIESTPLYIVRKIGALGDSAMILDYALSEDAALDIIIAADETGKIKH